mmetsp:Transcript_27737/g.58633  ORF Transcript_27737/g.58633 Transcript_27737/m.58633 type:complete len:375 (-) Transcript_27737:47-1171(-)
MRSVVQSVGRASCHGAGARQRQRRCAFGSVESGSPQWAPSPRAGWSRPQRRAGGEGVGAAGRRLVPAQAMTEGQESESVSPAVLGDDTVWELDFCSRPLLDERGKKRWELLVCNSSRTFEHSEFLPNNKINSVVLKERLEQVIEAQGGKKPRKVLYFRTQLQTIVTRALDELQIKGVASKRCFSIMSWLDERLENVYKPDPGYDEKATAGFAPVQDAIPKELSDALRGEQWLFVQMDWASLKEEMKDVLDGKAFGEIFDPEAQCRMQITDDTLIPGVAIFSRRANPLSGWTASLDLSNLKPDKKRACLVLETGVNNKWKYAAFEKTEENLEEAAAWEAAKEEVGGIHFLAIQDDPDAETCAGLWLLLDRPLPQV